ncbi:MAG: hypothetical protein V3V28_01805 [Polaribacter sp.]|uniref:hypothetical protein n=1 Tax=Polaribacter sp. TaxID=1920175 RepID=UPI002F34F0F9
MKKSSLLIVLLFLSYSLLSQNKDNKWTFGASLASAKYMTTFQAQKVGGGFVYQTPRLNLSKYLFYNITFDAAISTAIGDTQKYTTFDGAIRYDFGTSNNNVVPYLMLGGSFIKAKALTPTLNFGAGNTFWFSEKYGLNLQLMYKYSQEKFQSQFSHFYTSIGLVYSFGTRSMSPRLWNDNH